MSKIFKKKTNLRTRCVFCAFMAAAMLIPALAGCGGGDEGRKLPLFDSEAGPYSAVFVGGSEGGYTEQDAVIRNISTAPDGAWDFVSPSVFHPEPEEKALTVREGDIYVALPEDGGSDESGDGSAKKPFASVDRARRAVRQMIDDGTLPQGGIEVCIKAGKYTLDETLHFTSRDSGTEESPITYRAYGDGEVILTLGTEINADDFRPVTDYGTFGDESLDKAADEMIARFGDDVRDEIMVLDLDPYNIPLAASKLYAIGTENVLEWDSRYGGISGELYVDEVNMTLARWPNGEEMSTTSVMIDPEGSSRPCYVLTDEAAERAANWENSRDVWILGMFMRDYHDTSYPITVYPEEGYAKVTANVQRSDYSAGTPCYFYNIPEELDCPGEWYLDRTNMLMYLYPPQGGLTDVEFSTRACDIVNLERASNIRFEDITFRGTRDGSGFILRDIENIALTDCVIADVGEKGLEGYGIGLTVSGCEFKYIGGEALGFSGGEKATLTSGEVLIENNEFHHWSLRTRAFGVGMGLTMYSGRVSHNYFHDSTAPALGVTGCDNIIEYNIIRDCTTYASDCGAYYSGSSWTSGGNELRYNIFYNIGSKYNTPAAIFWDDGMSLQRAYGNLFMNITGNGFSLGAGWGLSITNNIFINIGRSPIYYDPRSAGTVTENNVIGDGFFQYGGFLWNLYKSTPYESEVWRESFPMLAEIEQIEDFDVSNPHFPFHSAFSMFKENVVVLPISFRADADTPLSGRIASLIGMMNTAAQKYSTIENNVSFTNIEDVGFADPSVGDYRLREDSIVFEKIPSFEEIPYHLMGQY